VKHTISVLVENKFGVLARVAGLFSARGFNIESLAVGETDDPAISRMTIVTEGDEKTLEQIKKQLNKLIDIITVRDFLKKEHVERELVLIKVTVNSKNKNDVLKIADSAGGEAVHVGSKSITIEATGDERKIKGLLEALKPFGILEVVRTGRIAIGIEDK